MANNKKKKAKTKKDKKMVTESFPESGTTGTDIPNGGTQPAPEKATTAAGDSDPSATILIVPVVRNCSLETDSIGCTNGIDSNGTLMIAVNDDTEGTKSVFEKSTAAERNKNESCSSTPVLERSYEDMDVDSPTTPPPGLSENGHQPILFMSSPTVRKVHRTRSTNKGEQNWESTDSSSSSEENYLINEEQGKSPMYWHLKTAPYLGCPPPAREVTPVDDPSCPPRIVNVFHQYRETARDVLSAASASSGEPPINEFALNSMTKQFQDWKCTEVVDATMLAKNNDIIVLDFKEGAKEQVRNGTFSVVPKSENKAQLHNKAAEGSQKPAKKEKASGAASNTKKPALSMPEKKSDTSKAERNLDKTSPLWKVIESTEKFREKVGRSLSQTKVGKCIAPTCKKPAIVRCPACQLAYFCSQKHLRYFTKQHEATCLTKVKYIERPELGKVAVAAQNVSCGVDLVENEPIVLLPLNPMWREGIMRPPLPDFYCVKCFKQVADKSEILGPCADCSLTICKQPCEALCDRIPSHGECKALKIMKEVLAKTPTAQWPLIDHKVVTMLRLFLSDSSGSQKIIEKLMKMCSSFKIGPPTQVVRNRIHLLRKQNLIGENITDEDLLKLDFAVQRFGRNIEMGYIHPASLSLKCVYPDISFALHSCVPNCELKMLQEHDLCIASQHDLTKGETLTICYDDRCLFYPTWKRRQHLLHEFSFVCKCKRCSTQSELDTYFSAFPCSCKKGYIMPTNPLENGSNWMCSGCRKHETGYLRAEALLEALHRELEAVSDDALKLWKLMTELVASKYLHWNHYLVYDFGIKFFEAMWHEFNRGDMRLVTAYSNERGLQFLDIAESVLHLSRKFMPTKYPRFHILPLRLAAIIKLRHTTDQIRTEEIKIQKVDEIVKNIYFRGSPALYLQKAGGSVDDRQEFYLRVLEYKITRALVEALTPVYGKNLNELLPKDAPHVARLLNFKSEYDKTEEVYVKIRGNDFSPWRIQV